MTKQALSLLESLEITIEDAEIPIVSFEAGICTWIDQIGYRWKGTPSQRSVMIEIKTGYSGATDLTKDSIRYQICAEAVVLKKEYGIRFDDYLVLYLGQKDGSKAFMTPVDINNPLMECVYEELCAHRIARIDPEK
jgi:hypothetical protein